MVIIIHNTFEELENTLQRVEFLLRADPSLRENDNLLIFAFWKYFEGLEEINKHTVLPLVSAETITRCRRKIQAQGKYLPSTVVRNDRACRQSLVKEWVLR